MSILLKRFEGYEWSIARMAFLLAQEILGLREVIDGVRGAIGIGRSKFVISFQIQSKI